MCICGLCPSPGVQPLEACEERVIACFEKGKVLQLSFWSGFFFFSLDFAYVHEDLDG